MRLKCAHILTWTSKNRINSRIQILAILISMIESKHIYTFKRKKKRLCTCPDDPFSLRLVIRQGRTTPISIPLWQDCRHQPLQPFRTRTWPKTWIIPSDRTWISPTISLSNAPCTRGKPSLGPLQQLPVYPIQYFVIPCKLPCKGRPAFNHFVVVFWGEGEWVLFWRVVPCNVMEVVTDNLEGWYKQSI